VQFQAVLQLSAGSPQIYNLPYLHRQMIEILGVKNAEKIIPIEDDMAPVDPVTENMDLMRGKPVKAFMIQDHEAHLGVHMAAIQDPKIAKIMGQNPQAQAIMASAQAHIMEHVAFQYRREIEKMLGAALPPMEDGEDQKKLPPEMEAQLAQLSAMAAKKVLQNNTAESQQQQIQQQQQDPLVQMQKQELQIKQQEAQSKAQLGQAEQQRKLQKDQMDSQAKSEDLLLRQEALQAKNQYDDQNLQIKREALERQQDGNRLKLSRTQQ